MINHHLPSICMTHLPIYYLYTCLSVHLPIIYSSINLPTSHAFINHVSINHPYSTVGSKSVYTRRQHYEADVLYTEPGSLPNG